MTAAQENRPVFFTVTDPLEGEQIRFFSAPIVEEDQLAGIVQIAQSLGSIEETLARLVTVIFLGAPFLVGFAGLGGYFLVARALAPIDKMTSTARRISAEDLSARLDLPGTHDEVGRLAATFDNMIRRLDEAFQRERQFTSDASHELRTPLAAMQAIISVIRQERRSPEDYEQALDDLAEETDRLRVLTDDLLKLARNDPKTTLDLEEVDIATLLSDLHDSLRPLAEKKGLKLTYALPERVAITADRDSLIRLFVNLLDNAIKYTPDGEISTSLNTRPDGLVEVSIQDTGPGISAKDLPHIFERFYRVDQSRATRGSGLGLAIAADIARAHGGKIIASSPDGQGTTFTVQLPVTPRNAMAQGKIELLPALSPKKWDA